MPLGSRVALIPTMGIDQYGQGEKVIDIACHQATCYWLYEEAKGSAPTGVNYTTGVLGKQDTMNAIAALGQRVRNAGALSGLPSGTVLLFTDTSGHPQHSCIIAQNGDIGGHKQPLRVYGGLPHIFSSHPRPAIYLSHGR